MIEPLGTYVSEEYTYKDYLDLNFKIDSPKEIWDEAIKIFSDRIKIRYFSAIEKLMEKTDKYSMRKYGFAIVTLQCSLIDTLSNFRYGEDKQGNKERFTSFLKEYIIKGENADKLAKKVYEDIRCGIVHSGATDNMSGLSCELPRLVTELAGGKSISLDIIVLQRELKKYYIKYIEKIQDEKETEIRKNFVHTMDKVCKYKNYQKHKKKK